MSSALPLSKRLKYLLFLTKYHIRTVYLFTEADFKTMFIPTLAFVWVIVPAVSATGLFGLFVWTWMHLLQANLSNQHNSGEEDRIDKPQRPIPSGRITPHQAYIFYLCIIPCCISFSMVFGLPAVGASILLTLLLMAYNLLQLRDGHPITRNVMNSGLYFALELGAALALSAPVPLDRVAILGLACSTLVILTTIHAQDFPDVEGDATSGRRTFPIIAPRVSRFGMLPLLMAWSIGLSILWELNFMWASIISALGAYVGTRYLRYNGRDQDKRSYRWYNVWLMVVRLMPIAVRLSGAQPAPLRCFFTCDAASA